MNGIVVLISGRGSNLKAICYEGLSSQIKCVISNKPDALGLIYAQEMGINTAVIDNKNYTTRELFENKLAEEIKKHNPKLIVLAGFMRILTPSFIQQFPQQIINIHPSLLPSFVGVDAVKQAFDFGTKITGATVHIVTENLDHGPILAQGVVSVMQNDNLDTLIKKVLHIEHTILPFVIHKILNNETDLHTTHPKLLYHENDIVLLGYPNTQIFY